jgi:hypothetical protein
MMNTPLALPGYNLEDRLDPERATRNTLSNALCSEPR